MMSRGLLGRICLLCILPFAAQPALFSNCLSLLCNCSVLQQIRQTVSESTSILIVLWQLSVTYLITEHLRKHHKGFKDSVTHPWVMWKSDMKEFLGKTKKWKTTNIMNAETLKISEKNVFYVAICLDSLKLFQRYPSMQQL